VLSAYLDFLSYSSPVVPPAPRSPLSAPSSLVPLLPMPMGPPALTPVPTSLGSTHQIGPLCVPLPTAPSSGHTTSTVSPALSWPWSSFHRPTPSPLLNPGFQFIDPAPSQEQSFALFPSLYSTLSQLQSTLFSSTPTPRVQLPSLLLFAYSLSWPQPTTSSLTGWALSFHHGPKRLGVWPCSQTLNAKPLLPSVQRTPPPHPWMLRLPLLPRMWVLQPPPLLHPVDMQLLLLLHHPPWPLPWKWTSLWTPSPSKVPHHLAAIMVPPSPLLQPAPQPSLPWHNALLQPLWPKALLQPPTQSTPT